MRNLLNFLVKYNYWFLFIFLEVISLGLLFRFNHYQKGAFFTSANVVVGKIYQTSGGITSYFHLKSNNEGLLERNAMLEQRISALEQALREYQPDSVGILAGFNAKDANYDMFRAHVINNSLSKADNYITLDKGSADGIRPEMGVVDGRGVLGIVYMTSPAYSVVISLLNSKSNISCKIKSSEYFGYLKRGRKRFQVCIPERPAPACRFNLGDTVITSGYSAVFPEGAIVGTVDDMTDSNDGLSYNLKGKLAADFGKLSNVRVLARRGQQEQLELEKRTVEQ